MDGFIEAGPDGKETVYTAEGCNGGQFCVFANEEGDDFRCNGCGDRMSRDGFSMVDLSTIENTQAEETARLKMESAESEGEY